MKSLFTSLLLILLLFLLPACGGDGTSGGGDGKVIAVGSQWYGHIPVWVGIENGHFADHGIEVEWRTIGKSMDRLLAISSGDAQFASLGQIAMLSAMAQGKQGFYWVGNQNIAPGFEGLVARSGITTFEQLRGGKIGFPFGSSVDLTCRMLLRENGIDPVRDVRLVNLEVGDVPRAFRNGNVDAALIWEPGFSELTAVEGATVLGMDTDTPVYQRFGTMTGPDVLILSSAFADEHPERARALLEAYFEALAWVKEHPDEAAEIVHAKGYLTQDLDLIKENLGRFIWHTADDQREVMSDEGLFGQTGYVLGILHDDMKVIPEKPDFRKWVRLDLLPGRGEAGGGESPGDDE